MTSRPRVELVGVTQTFDAPAGGHARTLALDEVSLTVRRHEIVALVGPSGCGKSTILNLIAGFIAPTQGEVLLDGAPLEGIGPQRLVVFQSPALFPWLNVMQNVTFGPRMRGARESDYVGLAQRIIADVGLEGFERHYPYQLSGGMRQRTQIARALINEPEVLLLDEPFGALDAQTRLAMQSMLVQVWDRYRATILFITHDVDEALFLSDRTYVLSARPGRIVREIAVPFARPRDYSLLGHRDFSALKSEVLALLHFGASTDRAAGAAV